MSIGQRIKAARKEANMTQAQLAELVGLSTITIRQYESDKREPRYQIIEKLSKALKCSISELLDPGQATQIIKDQIQDNALDIFAESELFKEILWQIHLEAANVARGKIDREQIIWRCMKLFEVLIGQILDSEVEKQRNSNKTEED